MARNTTHGHTTGLQVSHGFYIESNSIVEIIVITNFCLLLR